MKTDTQRNVPWAFFIFLLLMLVINITLFAPYMLALYFGWIISTVLSPMQNKLVSKKWKPTRAALFCTLVSLFSMIIPIAGFGFALVKNIIRVLGPYTKTGFDIDRWIAKIYAIPLTHRMFDDQEELRAFLDENSKKALGKITESLSNTLSASPEAALQTVLVLLTVYFILVDGKKMREWVGPRIPLPMETKSQFVKNLNDMAYSSFLSMLAAAVAQSLVVFLGFLLLGVPLAPLALGVAFVFAWFPIFGVTPVWAAALVYLIVTDQVGGAIGMGIFGIAASLVDNIVRPWVLKGRADMHPLVSLVAIFGGIAYMGIPGVLVGPVVTGFFIELFRIWPQFAPGLGLSSGERAPVTIKEKGKA